MRPVNFIILFLFTAINTGVLFAKIPDYLWEPYPQTASSGIAGTGTGRAEDIRFIGRNPASLAGVRHNILIIDRHTPFQDDVGRSSMTGAVSNYLGIAFPVNLWNFSLGSSLRQTPENTSPVFSGASLVIARMLGRYRLGTGVSYYEGIPGELDSRFAFDTGAIYNVKNNTKNFFGFHDFGLGGRLRIDYAEGFPGQQNFSLGVTPGFSVVFLRNKWFQARFQLDLPFSRDFTDFPAYFGSELLFFNTVFVTGGFSGKDFFTSERMHIGFGLTLQYDSLAVLSGAAGKNESKDIKTLSQYPDFSLLIGYDSSFNENFFIEDDKYLKEYMITPDGDGVQDFAEILLPADTVADAKDWQLQILDKERKMVFSMENKFLDAKTHGQSPAKLVWNATKADGTIVADGEYAGYLYVLKPKGDVLRFRIAAVNVKTSPAEIQVIMQPLQIDFNNRLISLNTRVDGEKANVSEIFVTIKNQNGELLFSESCPGTALPCEFKWFPHSANSLHPGKYKAEVFAADSFETKKKITEKYIAIENAQLSGELQADPPVISGVILANTGMQLSLKVSDMYANKNGIIKFRDESGKLLSEFKFKLLKTQKLKWFGKGMNKDFTGKLYIAAYATLENSESVLALADAFIDSTSPVVNIQASPALGFTPGHKKTSQLTIDSRVQDDSEIVESELIVTDAFNEKVATEKYTGLISPRLLWNGISNGKPVLRGTSRYFLQVACQDIAGNRGISNKLPIYTGPILEEVEVKTKKIRTISDLGQIIDLKERNAFKLQLNNLYFITDSATLTEKSGYQFMTEVAPILADLKNFRFIIEGHVNPLGPPRRWKRLSELRALEVKRLLVKSGIPDERILTIGRGGEFPVVPASSKKSSDLNMRVEIIVQRENEVK